MNFAAETHVDRSISGPAEFIVTDVLGTQVLLDHVRQHEIRLVQVSTDEVYGDVPAGAAACTEDAPLRPSSPYSASKAGGDMQVLAYVRTYGVDACITRGANNYGSRQYPEKFLPLFITNAFDGDPLPVYGDGRQRREWLHADDYSAAIELVMRKAPAGEVYNVGGQECENMDVVRRILDLTGASPDLVRHVKDRPGHDRRYAVDSSKAMALGWKPAHSFRRAASRRPSSGTASTAAGGSRSSRASSATTTTTSTASSPAEWGHPKGAGGPRGALLRCAMVRRAFAAATIAALGLGGVASAALFSAPSSAPPPAATSVTDATSTDSSVIVLTGHGYGHGIGMGQWGAYGYALHGWSAARILAHYYTGTTIGQDATKVVRVLLADDEAAVTVGSPAPWKLVDGAGARMKLPAGTLTVPPSLELHGRSSCRRSP